MIDSGGSGAAVPGARGNAVWRGHVAPALVVALLSLLFAGCAPPIKPAGPLGQTGDGLEAEGEQRQVVREFLELQRRLRSVEYPLMTANADLCYADVAPRLGLDLLTEYDFSETWRTAARSELGLGQALQVIHVVPNSAAARAGLADGDRLIAINGNPFPLDATGGDTIRELSETLLADAPYEVTYQREEIEYRTRLVPELGCRHRSTVIRGDQLEIFVSDAQLLVTTKTLEFLPQDDDLAAVLAIELIRDARDHDTRRRINTAGAYVGDIALAIFLGINTNGALSQAASDTLGANYAEEADYLALYVLARAGYDYRRVPQVLERIADDTTGSVADAYQTAHPLTLDRYAAVDAAVRDLEEIQTQGKPLEPDPEYLASYSEAGNEDRRARFD